MENYVKRKDDTYGSVFYNSKEQYHRLDGPAREYVNGDKIWCTNGRTHRLNGPAVVWANANEIWWANNEWWINGYAYTKLEHNSLVLFSVLEPKRIDINPTEED